MKNVGTCNKNEIIDILDYRGIHLDFYRDDDGQQVYTKFNDKKIPFGAYNNYYKLEAKDILDEFLDNIPISSWDYNSCYFGAQVKWFKNEKTKRWNIRLTYKTELIAEWDDPYSSPITSEIPPNLSMHEIIKLTSESEKALDKYFKYILKNKWRI